MEWSTAIALFRKQRAASSRPPPSFTVVQLARAVDAIDESQVDVIEGQFSWRGDVPIGEDTVQAALAVPGVRVLRVIAGSGNVSSGGGVNTLDVGRGWPVELSTRFTAGQILPLAGALAVRFAGSLANLWDRAAQRDYWTPDQIRRIRAVVAVGVPVVPSLTSQRPPLWTSERAEDFAALVGQFQGLTRLYTSGRIAEASAEAERAARDASFWNTVAFWEGRTPQTEDDSTGSGFLAEWWDRVKGLWSSWFGKLATLALIAGLIWLAWTYRASIGRLFAKRTKKAPAAPASKPTGGKGGVTVNVLPGSA